MKQLLMVLAFLALSSCGAGGGLGGDWIYRQAVDPISGKPGSFALLMLPSDRFSNEPSYLSATCDSSGFQFLIGSAGFWGFDSPAFRKNQIFEMRVGETVFRGRYLASTDGDSAFLISSKPSHRAVDPRKLIAAFSIAGSVAVRVSDYRGTTTTVVRGIGGKSEGLSRVAAECGIQ